MWALKGVLKGGSHLNLFFRSLCCWLGCSGRAGSASAAPESNPNGCFIHCSSLVPHRFNHHKPWDLFLVNSGGVGCCGRTFCVFWDRGLVVSLQTHFCRLQIHFFYFIFPLFVLLLCNRISKKYSFEVALEGAGALGRALQLSGQMPRASLSL